MSRPALDWAWSLQQLRAADGRRRLPPSQLLVLLAYARVADAEGRGARLKAATLEAVTGLSRSAVRAAVAELRRRRLLLPAGRTARGVLVYDLPVSGDVEQLALTLWGDRVEPVEKLRNTCGESAESPN